MIISFNCLQNKMRNAHAVAEDLITNKNIEPMGDIIFNIDMVARYNGKVKRKTSGYYRLNSPRNSKLSTYCTKYLPIEPIYSINAFNRRMFL